MKIAIVILNWNGKKLLEEFLPSVVKHSANEAKVYVADNGSTDDSISFLESQFPNVQLIKLSENNGFAQGYNLALQEVEEDIYVILNSDVAVKKDWLMGVSDYFEKHPNRAAIQPAMIDYRNQEQFEYAGAGGGFIDKNGFAFCDGRVFNDIEAYREKDAKEIFWASGAALIIRKTVFRETSGFDSDFFAHMEEIDLCWRVKNLGYEIWYYPQSKVYHLGGGTLGKLKPKKTYLNFRNNLFLLTKNYYASPLFLKLFWRMLLDGIAAWKFLIQGSPLHFLAVGKAHFHFYTGFFKMYSKRKALKKKCSKPNMKGMYKGNVIFEYFLQKKKVFADLDQSKF